MAKRDGEEDEEGLAGVLFGDGKPKLKDLADPRKRKQAMRVAKMMGIDIRREQIVRIGIGVAVVLVVLLIGLWAIAKVLGLLFWAILAMAAVAVVVKLTSAKGAPEKRIEPQVPRTLDVDRKELEARERAADRKADQALEELEKRLKG